MHVCQENFDFLKAPIFGKILKWPWSHQKLTYFKIYQKGSKDMSSDVLSPNLTKKFQWEMSQIANKKISHVML